MKSTDQIHIALERLIEEEEELRKISPTDGALGRNASDYHQMYSLFMQIVEQAKSIRLDPKAFVTATGYNDRMLNAYTKMVSVGMKAISELNRMRNNDRMVAYMLDKQTRDLIQSVTIDIGIELKSLIDALDRGEQSDDLAVRIKKLMYRRLPDIFLKSASSTLESAKSEFGLLH